MNFILHGEDRSLVLRAYQCLGSIDSVYLAAVAFVLHFIPMFLLNTSVLLNRFVVYCVPFISSCVCMKHSLRTSLKIMPLYLYLQDT